MDDPARIRLSSPVGEARDGAPAERPDAGNGATPPRTGRPARLVPAGLDATLALVRHGESTAIAEGRFQGASDPPLTALGERQAELVARRLADPGAPPPLPLPTGAPLACWHSPLSRAASVAGQIAAAQPVAVPLHAESGFREIGQGSWEGRLLADIQGTPADALLLAGWRAHPTRVHAPGGESLSEAAARVRLGAAALLGELAAAARPGAASSPVLGYGMPARGEPWAIVVGHDGVFRLLVCLLLGLPLERFWSFPFAPCAISVVQVRAGRSTVRAHNLDAHLAALEESGARPSRERDRGGGL